MHQLWHKNLVQCYNNTISTLACAVSCHIKPLWSNLSHHSCFNWPSEVCYIIAVIGSRRGNRGAHLMLLFQINTASHPPLAKLEREWHLNGMRGSERHLCGRSWIFRDFISPWSVSTLQLSVYFLFSTSASLYLGSFHSAVGRDFSLCCRGIQHRRQDDSCKPSKR